MSPPPTSPLPLAPPPTSPSPLSPPPRGRTPRLASGQGARDVHELARSVDLRAEVRPGGAVYERHRHFFDPHALAQQADSRAGLRAPARRERPGRLERRPGQAALPVERFGRAPACDPFDAGPR